MSSDNSVFSILDVFFVLIYFIGCLLFSFYKSYKITTIKEYALGGKEFSSAVLVGTVFATSISSYSTIGTIERITALGFFFVLTFLTKPVFFMLTGKILSKGAGKFKGCLSVSDIIGEMYGEVPKLITSVAVVVMSVGMVAIQVFAMSTILKFVGYNELWHLLLASFVFIAYSSLGGIRAVSVTDLFQFFVFFLALPIVCIKCLVDVGGFNGVYNKLGASYFTTPAGKDEWLLFISIIVFNAIPGLAPPIVQRGLMISNKAKVLSTFRVSAVLCVLLFIMVAIIGMCYKASGLCGQDDVVNALFSDLPNGFKGIILAGFLAIIMSTADSYLNTASIVFTADILGKATNFGKSINTVRIVSVIIGTISIPIALSDINIVGFFLGLNNFWIPVVLVPLVVGFYGVADSNKGIFSSSVLGGILFSTAGAFYFGGLNASSTISGLIGSLLFVLILILYRNGINPDRCIKIIRKVNDGIDEGTLPFAVWSLSVNVLGVIVLYDSNLLYVFMSGAALSIISIFYNRGNIKNGGKYGKLFVFCNYGIILLMMLVLVCVVLSSNELLNKFLFVSSTIFVLLVIPCVRYGIHAACLAALMFGILSLKLVIPFFEENFISDVFTVFTIILNFFAMGASWYAMKDKRVRFERQVLVLSKISDKYYDASNTIELDDDLEWLMIRKIKAEKTFVEGMHAVLQELSTEGMNFQANKTTQLPIKIKSRKIENVIDLRHVCEVLKGLAMLDASRCKIALSISCDNEQVKLDICRHYLTQIFFSLIYNMIYLVNINETIDVDICISEGELFFNTKYTGVGFKKDELVIFTKKKKICKCLYFDF